MRLGINLGKKDGVVDGAALADSGGEWASGPVVLSCEAAGGATVPIDLEEEENSTRVTQEHSG